ncbi:MAG: type II toxin-antitoxin system HicB family antitoxin [Chitinophagaceae bacterium]|nr:type II toxin-antitoxin system HicB family antitoxin [Anaerolineae bacterium]
MRYAIIIEKDDDTGSYGAYAPDLPGCGAAADTLEEVIELFREAVQMHIELLRETGQPVPEPITRVDYVEMV